MTTPESYPRLKGRTRMRAGSVRTQLILWNTAALAVLLAGMGLTVRYTIKGLMLRSIDADLANQVRRGPGPPPPAPGSPEARPSSQLPPQDSGLPGRLPPDGDEPGGYPPDRSRPERDPDDIGNDRGEPNETPPLPGARHDMLQPARPMPHAILSMDGISLDPNSGRMKPWDNGAFYAMRARCSGTVLSVAGIHSYDTVSIDGAPFRLMTLGRMDPRWHVPAILQVPYPLTDVYRALGQLDTALLTMIPIGLLCAAGGGWFLTGRVLNRVSRMTASASEIGVRDLSQRLPVVGSDEFSELAATFNGMLGRLESVFNEQERLIALQRQFTADASHELKTPLTIIKGNTSLSLTSSPSADQYKQSISEIDCAANTMSRLVQDLLLLARSDSGLAAKERIDVPVQELINQAITSTRIPENIELCMFVQDESLCVNGCQDELVRVLRNLLDNAVQYSIGPGTIEITAVREHNGVVIEVRDEGQGIAPEHIGHLGERFYRADLSRSRPSGGSGLGLAICKGILDAHNGTVSIKSEPGKGTTVTVVLPASSA